jgi:site-specific DNA-methyltransferase (adenine-specific)
LSEARERPHSIAKAFAIETGNIWFEWAENTWVEGRCRFCGASQKALDRGEALKTHACAFIHSEDIKARVAESLGAIRSSTLLLEIRHTK